MTPTASRISVSTKDVVDMVGLAGNGRLAGAARRPCTGDRPEDGKDTVPEAGPSAPARAEGRHT